MNGTSKEKSTEGGTCVVEECALGICDMSKGPCVHDAAPESSGSISKFNQLTGVEESYTRQAGLDLEDSESLADDLEKERDQCPRSPVGNPGGEGTIAKP